MKKILTVIVFSALLYSCGMSKEEKLIADYEQTMGNAKMDLKFDPQETKHIRTLTLRDSIEHYQSEVEEIIQERLEDYSKSKKLAQEYIQEYTEKLKGETIAEVVKITNEFIENRKADIKGYDEKLAALNANPYETILPEPYKSRYKSFEANPDSVIGDIYESRYKIFNPIMQLEQEITNQYLISPDKEKIIKKLE